VQSSSGRRRPGGNRTAPGAKFRKSRLETARRLTVELTSRRELAFYSLRLLVRINSSSENLPGPVNARAVKRIMNSAALTGITNHSAPDRSASNSAQAQLAVLSYYCRSGLWLLGYESLPAR
jgi:hypothetical protein